MEATKVWNEQRQAQLNKLVLVEFKGQRVLLTEQLADVYETDVNNIHANFKRNESHFEKGKHYFKLEGLDLKEFKNQPTISQLVSKNTSSLYLWTERGANRHCKILDTDKAWEQFDNLEEVYFRVKQLTLNTSQLSPELQMFNSIFNAVAKIELSNKQLQDEVQAIKEHSQEELQNMRDVITLNPNSWREDSRKLISKIALKLGGYNYISDVTKEIYSLMDIRLSSRLSVRLTNKRRRMADEGVCKSKRDKLTYLDVIADDKKLIEGYKAIVKEMAIKYGVA